jgi:O-antigen/teichoic acid export membrane protein
MKLVEAGSKNVASVPSEPGAEAVAAPTRGSSGPSAGRSGRVLRNSTQNLVAQGVYALFYLAVIALLTRGLGPEVYGEYAMVFATLLIVQIIVEMGMSTVLTRRLSQRPERWREAVAEAVGLYTLIVAASIGVFCLIGVGCAWWRGDASIWPVYLAAGVACAGFQVQRFGAGVCHSREQFTTDNITRILQVVIFVVLLVLQVLLGWVSLTIAMASLAISYVASAILLIVLVQRSYHCLGFRLSWATVKDWLRESVPLGLGDGVRSLNQQFDVLLLGLFQPAAVVGIYNMASRAQGPINWLPRAIMLAAFPALARHADSDRDALNRAFAACIRLLWIVSLPIAMSLSVCAERVVVLLGGVEFLPAALPLRFLIWNTSLLFLSFQFRFLFSAMGRSQTYIRLVVPILILALSVEAALVPWIGLYGAIIGSMLGETVLTVSGLFICYRLGLRGIEWGAMAKAVLAALAMGAVLWTAREVSLPLLMLVGLLSLLVYFGMCVVLGAVRRDEVKHLYEVLTGVLRQRGKTAGEPELSASHCPAQS